MSQGRRPVPSPQLELEQIQQEAQYRWLRPVEVCKLLSNCSSFMLSDKAPVNPPAGSLFLFNRKSLRYYRKDGHDWRKKKDGKTVKEAHEKLKIGSVDVLHCYYAHGQFNGNFQRRCYWMLDEKFEHIVLVHYREVKEGYRSGISRVLAHPASQNDALSLTHDNSPNPSVQTCHASAGSNCHPSSSSCVWPEIPHSVTNTISMPNETLYVGQPTAGGDVDVLAVGESPQKLIQVLREYDNDEPLELKKLDSFGKWMDKEIGGDCDDSLMTSDSTNYWNALDTEIDDTVVSSLTHQMQLDVNSLGPSLCQEQLFSIIDYSPDWAYSGVETKVLIIGNFLRTKELSNVAKWGCMFGEIEVSAEVLTDNVIRCHVPPHVPGCVPFYITCSNRLACSEVREFDYREQPPEFSIIKEVKSTTQEEMHLQRLLKLLMGNG